jgi:serine/threonine protein phosphatase PrpC
VRLCVCLCGCVMQAVACAVPRGGRVYNVPCRVVHTPRTLALALSRAVSLALCLARSRSRSRSRSRCRSLSLFSLLSLALSCSLAHSLALSLSLSLFLSLSLSLSHPRTHAHTSQNYGVTADPQFIGWKVRAGMDFALILASDGVWNALGNENVVEVCVCVCVCVCALPRLHYRLLTLLKSTHSVGPGAQGQ